MFLSRTALMLAVLACAILTAEAAQSKVIPPTDPSIQYSGRFDNSLASAGRGVRFDWSSVSITLTVSRTASVAVWLQDRGNTYDVFLDGEIFVLPTPPLQANSTGNYTMVSGLSTSQHTVILRKRTEALFGVVTFFGFVVDSTAVTHQPDPAAAAAPSPFSPHRYQRMEWVGDSLSCGYGVLGMGPCPFDQSTENANVAWGALVADYFGAELHMQCWSGKGLVRNYGDVNTTSVDPMPLYARRTVANDPSLPPFNTSSWLADIVVLNLGSNDYSTEPHPLTDVFVNAYIALVQSWLDQYPNVQVFCACGPMEMDLMCDNIQKAVGWFGTLTPARVHYVELRVFRSLQDWQGCSGHPSTTGQIKMAMAMATAISNVKTT